MTTRAITDGAMSTGVFLTGAQEVAQNVKTRLLTFYGECFLENSQGVPWVETILGAGNATLYDKEAAVKAVILQTKGVEKMTFFSMKLEKRSYIIRTSIIANGESEQIEVTI